MTELGREARELIERAVRDEVPVDAAELVRIRSRVLAASVGTGILGATANALAVLGKSAAAAGPALKAALVGATLAAVALGLPMVLGNRGTDPARSRSHAAAGSLVSPASVRPLPNVGNAATSVDEPSRPSAKGAPLSELAPVTQAPPAASHAPKPVLHGEVSVQTPTFNAPGGTGAERPRASPQESAGAAGVPPLVSTQPLERRATANVSSFGVPLAGPANSVRPAAKSPLVQEVTLLENVQSELRAGHGARALALLDESASGLGAGQLQAERLAAEVFASCQAGQVSRARRAARVFLQSYPAMPASDRVRASCGGEKP